MSIELKQGIYWVGAIDWKLRNFHGFTTPRGGTYNAYLLIDEKITLIDSTKPEFAGELLRRIREIIDPSKIDYVICNHAEIDHSGSIPDVMKVAPNAKIITSVKGKAILERHHKQSWEYQLVKTNDEISIGARTLKFATIPMVHWPDSMVTYVVEDEILFSNDAFGQQIATWERFADEVSMDIVMEENQRYYANIVLPFANPVKNALKLVGGLKCAMIAPAHGVIFRTPEHIAQILESYRKWSNHEADQRAVIVYDTMWQSTAAMAKAIQAACEHLNIPYTIHNLSEDNLSLVTHEMMVSKYVFVGSPVLNNGLMPQVAGFLHYLKGFAPKKKVGMAFGSYGWSAQSAKLINATFEKLCWDILPSVEIDYFPDEDELVALTQTVITNLQADPTQFAHANPAECELI
ncbi:MAG: FprA family A-type flavoprotein [Culicoidibacterales bacterium]